MKEMKGFSRMEANLSAIAPLIFAFTVYVVAYAVLHPATLNTSNLDISVTPLARTLKTRADLAQFTWNVSAKPNVML